ncbi:carboxypeptidase regulatory-like domain-containing protein [Kribbella sp. NBC_00709]|uniref:carboxypeptidase regulatory-like domain-containing protein n=1 Tax=Kribbella sp. NBC_00709 TaxID=2975972 RepID=UPI002E2BAB46|nr:carboxypeptidase regulatory-like domain-containing protein [Kribbella sp. NBC_00709]
MSILFSRRRKDRGTAGLRRVRVAVLAVAVVAAGLTAGVAASAVSASAVSPASAQGSAQVQHPTEADCGRPSGPGQAVCMAMHRTDVQPAKGRLAPHVVPGGYGPAALQSAYALPSATAGADRTVAIVDAYDDPTAEADLAIYRAQYGLPVCSTANGCFRKVDQRGGTDYPVADPGWAGEISLDLDMVSAVCPNCNILLVEGDDASFDSLGTGVDQAVAMGAQYVSNSYGDQNGEAEADLDLNHYYDHPGVVVTASTGDWGYGAVYPATAPGVTAVGGTSLTQGSDGNWTEAVWNGAGSGCSRFQDKPAWQSDSGCADRTVADVSAVADPNTGVAVYNGYGNGGWSVYGGTSASAPIIASAYALAGAPQAGTNPAQYPYDSRTVGAGELTDVTSGTNGACDPAYLCTGVEGYDGPTGLGTPHGVGAFTYRAHGYITGTVKDKTTGQPIAAVKVQAGDRATTTDAKGNYDLDLPAATYQVSASAYGYDPVPVGVTVTAGSTTSQDLVLSPKPRSKVTGTVTDGSGHGWPLYAKVTSSDGESTFTDPVSGQYSLNLLQGADYTLHIASVESGYQPVDKAVTVGTSDVTEDATVTTALACTALGYQVARVGATQTFDAKKIPAGWKVTNTSLHLPGYDYQPGWVFNNPAARSNDTGGKGNFAIVDSDHDGQHNIQNTQLVSPVVNLSAAATPAIEFASDLEPAVNSTATVDVSINGGTTWTNVWRIAGSAGVPAAGTVVVPLPQAAHKARVQVRFGYTGQWSKWWAVDNVFVGNRTCTAEAGGLVAGQVTDDHGAGLNGAVVTSLTNPSRPTATVATPDDPNIGDGLYWLFSTTGRQTFTATMDGYNTQTATTTVSNDKTTQLPFSLQASG